MLRVGDFQGLGLRFRFRTWALRLLGFRVWIRGIRFKNSCFRIKIKRLVSSSSCVFDRGHHLLGPWVKSHPLVFSRIDRVSSWDSAKTRQFASSDMLVNLMIQPVSSCCLRFQWYRLPALSLERLPVESSVYMGNGWFGYAVMLWVITVTTYVCLQPVLVESSVHMGNG